jgi:hypothetical protein
MPASRHACDAYRDLARFAIRAVGSRPSRQAFLEAVAPSAFVARTLRVCGQEGRSYDAGHIARPRSQPA